MLPISLRPNGRRAVVVGGGKVAARKARSLAAAGFPVFVVAERIGDPLRDVLREFDAQSVQRRYEARDLDGAALVLAATDDAETNARVVADARAARVLVCDASAPDRGDFTMAATLRIGELTISADSGGSPAFSGRVLRELSERFGPEYGDAVRTLKRMRAHIKETFPGDEGAAILRSLAQRPVAELASMPLTTAVCATRRSPLAMIASRMVAARLAERGVATTMLGVTTSGDRDQHRPIEQLGEINVFVKELENALRERRADYAVHSCKDLASTLPDDMRIAAVSQREDARDAFCSERYPSFESLPPGAVVGTSSPRRRAQLRALRPDLTYEALRGNVDTRLRKLRDGEYDAIVLAMAGLRRLGIGAASVVPFEIERMVPAVGQGALAIETRSANDPIAELVHSAVNDATTALCVGAERAALRALHAGCNAPVGIHAHVVAERMVIESACAAENGTLIRRRAQSPVATLEAAEELGTALAAALIAAGAIASTGGAH